MTKSFSFDAPVGEHNQNRGKNGFSIVPLGDKTPPAHVLNQHLIIHIPHFLVIRTTTATHVPIIQESGFSLYLYFSIYILSEKL